MRDQGVAANAMPRFARGRNKGKTRDATYRAQQRGDPNVVRRRVADVADQLAQTKSFHDPARDRLTASGHLAPCQSRLTTTWTDSDGLIWIRRIETAVMCFGDL